MESRLRNFGFLLKEVSRRYVLRFEQHARGICLTLPQCKVLVRLQDHEGASQARLAELTDVEPMTMVRILDRMEAEGLLKRRADPADRRARRLYLTSKARPLLEQIWGLADLTRGEIFTGISRADRVRFMSVFERLHDNICALSEGPAGRGSAKPVPGPRANGRPNSGAKAAPSPRARGRPLSRAKNTDSRAKAGTSSRIKAGTGSRAKAGRHARSKSRRGLAVIPYG